MKKLIVITVLLAAVLGAGIAESIFMTRYFSSLAEELTDISEMTADVEEDVTDEVVIARLDIVIEGWKKREAAFYLLNNNNVLNNLFDRIVQAKTYALGGQNVDARSSMDTAAFFAQSVARDIKPVPINFL